MIIHSLGMVLGTTPLLGLHQLSTLEQRCQARDRESHVPRTLPSRQLGCSQPVLKAQRREFLAFLFNSTCLVIQSTADLWLNVLPSQDFLRLWEQSVLKSSELTFVYGWRWEAALVSKVRHRKQGVDIPACVPGSWQLCQHRGADTINGSGFCVQAVLGHWLTSAMRP